jgi:hypothetical protein
MSMRIDERESRGLSWVLPYLPRAAALKKKRKGGDGDAAERAGNHESHFIPLRDKYMPLLPTISYEVV